MSDNYYTSLLKHIESLIASGDYNNAKKLIDEELSMPFVPKDTLERLEQFKNIVEAETSEAKSTRIMSKDEVYDALKGQTEKAYMALETLSMSNIRNYLDVIRDLLEDDAVNHTLKALLIEQLSMQQVSEIVQIVDHGKIINVMPSAVPMAIAQKNFSVIEKLLEAKIPFNPTFLEQARMVLVNVAYDRYPAQIEDDKVEIVANSIIRYVYLAYGDNEGFESFKNDNNIDENTLEEYSF